MAQSLLDKIDDETQQLSPDEQLELARRLLNRSLSPPETGEQCEITDLVGIGKGTWRTAEEIDQYVQAERDSWEK